jgi:primosomal protein N' (replication factor Y)
MPRVSALGDDAELARDAAAATARLPTLAWETARDGLTRGPVLVQVPRRGYVPALACATCRAAARCAACAGPLALRARTAAPSCGWCGREAVPFDCRHCGGSTVRAAVVGARRTAEELGRAFPSVRVLTSGRDEVVARVGAGPALVVATPGAEPVADSGYAAALLLDGWALLGRADLRTGEEALRRWMAAAALVRPVSEGGAVVVHADASLTAVQALVRWDPVTAAERELAERRSLGFPPSVRFAELRGSAAAIDELAAGRLPPSAERLGPTPTGRADEQRLLLRVPLADAAALSAALRAGQSSRSARKAAEPVRVQVDPVPAVTR